MKKLFQMLALTFALAAIPTFAADPTEKDAIDLVNKAVKFYQTNGQEKAFKTFEDKAGEFVKGELYILVYDFSGVCLSHGANPKVIGKNRFDVEDVNGKKYIQEIITGAKGKGNGWVDYLFKNPETNKIEPKTTYFQKVEGKDLFIACGIYKPK